MNRQKCIVYPVNGLNIPMFDLEQRHRAYIGYTSKKGNVRKRFKSSEINVIEGNYKQIALTLSIKCIMR